jgi:membrane protein
VAHDRRRRWIFVWHDVRNFVRRVYEGAGESNVPFLASALAFDAILAAIPLGAVILAVVGEVLSANAAASRLDLADYLRQLLPSYGRGPSPFEPVIRLAENVVRSRAKLSLVGFPLFVWFSTRLFGSLRSALCEVFDTPETRSWIRGKLYDAGLVLATGVLFAASTVLSEGAGVLVGRIGFLAYFVAQLFAFAFLIALFVMIFKIAPAHRVRWDTALVAALTCAIGFDLAKELLGVYFRAVAQPEALASDATVGAVILFVAWVYYMTFVFLLGGQIAQVYELRRRQAAQRAALR